MNIFTLIESLAKHIPGTLGSVSLRLTIFIEVPLRWVPDDSGRNFISSDLLSLELRDMVKIIA